MKISFSAAFRTVSIALAFFCIVTRSLGADDLLALFNSSGEATAYIAEDLTVYLWSGKPVAYLSEAKAGFHIYGFNGKHLGWFVDGVARDHQGKAVGAVAEAFTIPLTFKSYKGYRQFKPLKAFKEIAPHKPMFTDKWSHQPFGIFLKQGASD